MNTFEKFFVQFKSIEQEAKKIWKENEPDSFAEDARIVKIEEDGITFEWEEHCWGTVTQSYYIPVHWFDK